MSPTHHAARIEDRLHGLLEARLVARGWTPHLTPYVGYGGAGWVRVLARVLLAPPRTPREARPERRGWRRFTSVSADGIEVTVQVGEATHVVTSGRDGYVDVRLPCDLPPGWGSVELSVGDTPPVTAPVRIVGDGTTYGILSDVDDTVIVTMLPKPLLAFRNAFLVHESARRPVPGMAALYADVLAAHPDAAVVYLSTGAWNTAGALGDFLDRNGYPPGPLLLTDWGPTAEGWFRSGRAHKHAQLERLFADLPQVRWLLVGDDGQHDPTIYAEAAQAHPDRVRAIAIRQLSVGEQLAHHGLPTGPDALTDAATEGGTPAVWAPDGAGLRAALEDRGLLRRGSP
ncbi:phosphatase domain-containing protein [Nocardioides sp. 503]|uniref:App1 family protein n=1 Tax=Nocardioides sp. 503 TaxID=2508326 RepID=UPI00106F6992|nr:phosphatase domain-containing protein [Nocardioides sp. 503]